MSWPICPTSGKQGFPSPPVARASLRNRQQRDRKAEKGYVYRCPDCRQWHLTRVPPEKSRKRRAS